MFEKIVVHVVTPDGWPVDFELAPGKGKLAEAISFLKYQGFEPAPTAEAARGYSMTPEGLPLCPRHGVVMKKREKQGDVWYSHPVAGADGQPHYCRGYAGKNSPGWHLGQGGDDGQG